MDKVPKSTSNLRAVLAAAFACGIATLVPTSVVLANPGMDGPGMGSDSDHHQESPPPQQQGSCCGGASHHDGPTPEQMGARAEAAAAQGTDDNGAGTTVVSGGGHNENQSGAIANLGQAEADADAAHAKKMADLDRQLEALKAASLAGGGTPANTGNSNGGDPVSWNDIIHALNGDVGAAIYVAGMGLSASSSPKTPPQTNTLTPASKPASPDDDKGMEAFNILGSKATAVGQEAAAQKAMAAGADLYAKLAKAVMPTATPGALPSPPSPPTSPSYQTPPSAAYVPPPEPAVAPSATPQPAPSAKPDDDMAGFKTFNRTQ